ncbi:hypothetical protein [Frigidibacter sp.]|uniref:hypothetical protein n=1 Tax=Frigidibacter sp. TaxID=2586418 RepID=UPI0027368407|nr:hypothetical protein [Frigidibacter sp.]MDP3339230.1 hypothetical protein [Frigidibacter sp.]
MKRFVILATAAATMFGSVSVSHAQSRSNDACRPGESRCEQQQGKRPVQQQGQQQGQRPQAERASPDRATNRPAAQKAPEHNQKRIASPRAGDNGKNGRPYQRAKGSRFKEPPRGQEYRVVNDHLVLVDNRTSKVVSVLGLLDTLLR